MHNLPLVSVGLPTYNRPHRLKNMLTCITGQTYKNLEIIVSDNASSDPTVIEILKEFQKLDMRVRYFVQPANKGPAFNFIFVLGQASGQYFIWAADDDEWKPSYIEECISVMDKHPEVSLCYSEAVLKNHNGYDEFIWQSDMSTIALAKLPGIRKVLKTQHRNTEFYGLLRTQLARDFRFKYYLGEDHSFVLFMAMNGKIAKVAPGLFVSSTEDTMGSSPEHVVNALGLPSWHRHLGYLILHVEMLKLAFKSKNGLRWYEKPVVAVYILERMFFVPRFRDSIKAGIGNFVNELGPWKTMKKFLDEIRSAWRSFVSFIADKW